MFGDIFWLLSFSLKFYLMEYIKEGTEPELGGLVTEVECTGTRDGVPPPPLGILIAQNINKEYLKKKI